MSILTYWTALQSRMVLRISLRTPHHCCLPNAFLFRSVICSVRRSPSTSCDYRCLGRPSSHVLYHMWVNKIIFRILSSAILIVWLQHSIRLSFMILTICHIHRIQVGSGIQELYYITLYSSFTHVAINSINFPEYF